MLTIWIKQNALLLAWLQALVATLGSLAFSEILLFPPCVLCWYQRTMMYPLAIILAIGYVKKDKLTPLFGLALSLIGLAIAAYHNLLYYNILPEAAAPCRNGVSCTTEYIHWLGFLTIPLLSLVAFVVITALLLLQWRINNEQGS